uniref:Uncharacterized protein n=1 Tax=Rhizophora mucronata TaxID=61149 RepID=A0A2P2KDU8_RHIMU
MQVYLLLEPAVKVFNARVCKEGCFWTRNCQSLSLGG